MLVDFNHGSGFVYGRDASEPKPLGARINSCIDAALVAEREGQRPRDYLGASRIGLKEINPRAHLRQNISIQFIK